MCKFSDRALNLIAEYSFFPIVFPQIIELFISSFNHHILSMCVIHDSRRNKTLVLEASLLSDHIVNFKGLGTIFE